MVCLKPNTYMAFFTYLYGISILFLLYVFCYLLSGSTRELPSKNQVFMLNIHKFKFLARFGLMHIVATNICVWVRTLVRESLKEINEFRVTQVQQDRYLYAFI
ncbi:hypothetical protein Avbf_03353 [Armadillidium vulgare]|nr:hypothetical protein Avbf_03353 [Armadillidium vulgare]